MTKSICSLAFSAIMVLFLAACHQNQNVEMTVNADNPGPYTTVGQIIKLKYSIKNTGTGDLSGAVSVTSDITSVSCPNLNTIGNKNSVLEVNEVINCTAEYAITQADLNKGSVTNNATANVSGANSSPVAVNISTGQNPSTPLTLTTTADTATYSQAGQQIIFSYEIRNTGTVNLGPAQFTISDNLINTTPFVCGSANTTLVPNGTVTCSATYKVTQADMTAVSIINIATASGGGAGPSPTASATVNRAGSNMALTLTTNADPLTYSQVGQQITISYEIKNTGTVNLGPDQFIINDNLISTTPFICGSGNTTLVPNATITCSATYKITQADMTAVSITNIATASGGGANPSNAASVTVKNTGIPNAGTRQHTVAAGEWLWQIARCYGVDPKKLAADNSDKIPNPSQIKPGTILIVNNPGSYSNYYGTPCVEPYLVQSGDTWNSIALKFNANPTVLQMANSNTLTVGKYIKVPRNSAGGAPASQTKVLALTTTADPTTYDQAGQNIVFTYNIKNNGTENIGPDQFKISDNLISTTPFNCGSANTTIVPNATVTCSATYAVTQADMTAVSITNIAIASGGGVASSSASATVNKGTKALTLTTSPSPTTYNAAGQQIIFSYVIKNNGTATLGPTQFTISDTLISATPFNCGSGNTTIAPNSTVSCSATYVITQEDMTAVSIISIATASGGGAGPSPAANATINRQ